jgi:hypothetical protein
MGNMWTGTKVKKGGDKCQRWMRRSATKRRSALHLGWDTVPLKIAFNRHEGGQAHHVQKKVAFLQRVFGL